ncbi:MAG: right-handed parallel beta-helix repeat-containing protein [Promethearchaeota archaeon]
MRRKLLLLPVMLIFVLFLQYGNQGFNQGFESSTQTIMDGIPEINWPIKSGIRTSTVTRGPSWDLIIAGYQGELPSLTTSASIAYVYLSDTSDKDSYCNLLESNGFTITPISLYDLTTDTDFTGYDLIILADDTGWNNKWGLYEMQILPIYESNRPILGLGEGGYAYFGQIELYIGSALGNQGIHGNLNSIEIVEEQSNHPIFTSPNPIGSGIVELYTESRHVSIHFSTTPEEVILFGRQPSSDHYPILMEQGKYFFWGFRESPDSMTDTGKDLMQNIVTFLLKFREPIFIDGDEDFAYQAALEGWPGSGTESDPYIIEGYKIFDSTANLVHIQNTMVYFTLRDNRLNGLSGSYNGTYLFNVKHGTLVDNTIYNCRTGVLLSDSSANTITNNYITHNLEYGVFLENSASNIIEYNTISNIGTLTASSRGTRSIQAFSRGHGIFLDPSNGNTISNNEILNNIGDGVSLIGSVDNTITENKIHDNGDISNGRSIQAFSRGHGIFLDPSDGNTISNNDIYNNDANGVSIIDSEYNTITGNKIHDNKGIAIPPPEDSGRSIQAFSRGHGIFLDPSNHTMISNNEIYNNNGDGVSVLDSSYNTISENIIRGNGDGAGGRATQAFSRGHGIFLDPSDHNTISNNDIYNNYYHGVFLVDSEYNTISDNDIHENGGAIDGRSIQAFSRGHGIFLDPSDHNTISNNNIYGNIGDGVSLLQSNDNTIVGNEIHDNKDSPDSLPVSSGRSVQAFSRGHGIFLDPSDNNKIINNTVYGNEGNGIILDESSSTTVMSNIISNNSYYGINVTSTTFSNDIVLNNFLGNNPGASQARDDGIDNEFVYNHWNDHDNTDNDGDQFADMPYYVEGNAASQDIAAPATEISFDEHKLYKPIILFPNYHDKVTVEVEINWLPAGDTGGHAFTYDLYYSDDAGKSWNELALGLIEDEYLWDISDFKSGSRYKTKIIATCSEGDSVVVESGKFEIYKIKKPIFPNPDKKGIDQTTTIAAASSWSLVIIVPSAAAILILRRFRRNS